MNDYKSIIVIPTRFVAAIFISNYGTWKPNEYRLIRQPLISRDMIKSTDTKRTFNNSTLE